MHELTAEQSYEILDAAEVAHLGVIADGDPYVTPVSFVRKGDKLVMRTADGMRLQALRENPRACLEVSVVDAATGDWKSVIAWGDVSEIQDEVAEAEAVGLFFEKYKRVEGPMTVWTVPELLPGTAVVLRLQISRMSGRSSGTGVSRSTRPGRL